MSSIWTPGGERPVGRPEPEPAPGPAAGAPPPGAELSDEELAARMHELQQQLADTPVELVIANHCYGLFELAALHLSLQPPQLPQAQTAIDALGLLVEGLAGRLGEPESQLKDGLAQLRMAFVQIRSANEGDEGAPPAQG
jgi:hypothetical protein